MRTATLLLLVLVVVLAAAPAVASIDLPVTISADYRNEMRLGGNNPAGNSAWTASYGGHVGAYRVPGSTEAASVPSGGGYVLQQSAFGQPVSAAVYPDYVNDNLRHAQDMLYYNDTAGASSTLNLEAAFRYKIYLYSRDPDTAKVRADFHGFDNMYGEAERIRAASAEAVILETLRHAPMDARIWNVLLDVYYDRAVAEIQFIKMKLANLSALRLGFTAQKVGEGELVIDREIEFYQNILEGHEAILDQYSRLFTETFGLDVSRYDPTAPAGIPVGYYLFQSEVPFRSLNASQFRDSDGIVRTVPDRHGNPLDPQEPLYAGYKDYVLLLSVLRDYARDASDLAKDYALRGRRGADQDDYAEAGDLLNRVQSELVFGKALLEGMFPGYPPAEDPDNAGVRAALNGVSVELGELNETKGLMRGEVNLLGFDPNFLILIQEYPLQIPEGNRFDSYDAIVAWLGQDFSPLDMARLTYAEARDSYTAYRGYADQVFNELSEIETTYNEEYFRIVGAQPDDPTHDVQNPAAGSELALAQQRIEAAKTRAADLHVKAASVTNQIERAVDFQDNVANKRAHSLETALGNYRGRVTGEWNSIRDWNMGQAASQATYDMVADIAQVDISLDPASWVGGAIDMALIAAAGAANIAVQTEGEKQKGNAQKAIDLAQAEYQKELALVDVDELQFEAEQTVMRLETELISATIDAHEAQALLNQEIARRNALMRQAARSIQMMEQNQQRVADRYYADPIHFIRAQNKVIEAEFAFREAQEWAFFAARALEYKYNKSFVHSFLGRDWQVSTLFQLRNYDELDNFFAALSDFNLVNITNLIGRNSFTDRLSVRSDFWSLAETVVEATATRPAQYRSADGSRLLSSVEKFREQVRASIDADNQIVLRLDTTNLNKTDGAFFVGPEYNNDLCVIQAGKWLDKIEWIKINLVGSHPERTFTGGNFAYAGNTCIRTLVPPCPVTPLEIPGDWMVYPFQFFFTLDNGATWQSRDAQSFTPILRFSAASGEPAGPDFENRGLKERSVAASRITLKIPAGQVDIDALTDVEIYVRHFFADRISPICPGCSGKPEFESERG